MLKKSLFLVLALLSQAYADASKDVPVGTWRISTPDPGKIVQPDPGQECRTMGPMRRLRAKIIDKGAAFLVDVHGSMALLVTGTDSLPSERQAIASAGTKHAFYAYWTLDPSTELGVCVLPDGKDRVQLDVSLIVYQLDDNGKRLPKQSCTETWHGPGLKEP